MAASHVGHKAPAVDGRHLALRAEVIGAVRGFFIENGFLEVETPIRIPAPAPEAYIDALPSESWFLHTSPEICMKRLLSAGYGRIFQICRCFRSGERGRRHLPEFTLLEWYAVGATYRDLMAFCEEMIRHVAGALDRGTGIVYQGRHIALDGAWQRLSVRQAFRRFAGQPAEAALAAGRFDELMAGAIEPRLGHPRPCFLYDYPIQRAALARCKPEDGSLAERFELYIAGMELCNAFTELTDAAEQRRRFQEELQRRETAGRMQTPMPEKFLADLERLPPCAGNALGIDRLVMLFADTACIDDVVAFTPEML